MYTVLIQSKKTMDCLEQFYPLLSENIETDNIGRCLWIESGATVDTAMPELYDLISRKRAWKAVIVCSEFDDINTKYPADSVNPYDFLENRDREGLTIVNDEVIDCDAPLIRLTHMLGGIPSPEPKFKATIIEPENRVPWMEYHPVEDDETAAQKKAYDAWNEANMFKGLPPTEIILVKVRKASTSRDMLSLVSSSWQVHTEADSSEFWKRNLYPHNCRFLVYDMDQRGIMKQQSDLFKFWIGILLISKNDIDPNVLQAHRLYSLNVILKESALEESFQQTINKLNMAKYQLEKSIAKDEEDISEVDAPIPDYSIGVPVSFQLPKVSDIHFDASQYGLTSGIGSEDMSSWNTYSKNAKKELQVLIQSTDRMLDQAASRLREQCEYSEADVVPLTQYQEEDFNVSLAEVYKDMLEQQESLPAKMSDVEEKINIANEKVKDAIIQRMTGSQAAFALGIAIGVIVLCLIPGLFFSQSKAVVGLAMLICAAILALGGLLVLVSQKNALIKLAKNFQMVFQDVIGELSHNASAFSDFLSSVASHIHGRSYLNIMKEKRQKRDSSYYFKQKHVKAIDIFLSKLSLWSSALHVKVDMKSVDAIELIDDLAGDIDYDSLYSFDVGKDFVVPLNRIGSDIESPFGFIERIEIEREEVYDNDKRG